MHPGIRPFRFVLTLLLASAVPFCCCDFRTVLSGCTSCGSSTQMAIDGSLHPEAAAATTSGDHEHCHGHSPRKDDHSPPPGKEPAKDSCACGKNSAKMLMVEKSAVEFSPPVVIAVLHWPLLTDIRPADLFRVSDRGHRAVLHPQTSLLRLHCALTV